MTLQATNKVVYDGTEFEINSNAYKDIEEKSKDIDKLLGLSEGEKDEAREWLVYDTLINEGHFVRKPQSTEPSIAKALSQPPDPFKTYPTYEPEWTKEKILAERERLIRKEAALLKAQQAEFNQRVKRLKAIEESKQGSNSWMFILFLMFLFTVTFFVFSWPTVMIMLVAVIVLALLMG